MHCRPLTQSKRALRQNRHRRIDYNLPLNGLNYVKSIVILMILDVKFVLSRCKRREIHTRVHKFT
jgi:hypothetical protein